MLKKIFTSSLAFLFAMGLAINPFADVAASTSYSGKLVSMEGIDAVYYVAADEKRYVFPNEKIYKSWFSDFDDVVQIPQQDLESLPLGGNVTYRPGMILVKIMTDPKVYAVSKGGSLRWIKTEAAAKALYGEEWAKLVDDISDAFFVNYQLGSSIEGLDDFDPDEEMINVATIDSDKGFANDNALKAQTKKCKIIEGERDCGHIDDEEDEEEDDKSGDTIAPFITSLRVSDLGEEGYIDNEDEIVIEFSEAINPKSIDSKLEAGGYFSILDFDVTGTIRVSDTGVVTIKNIASFDIGSVSRDGGFAAKLRLSSSAQVLTIAIADDERISIDNEEFEELDQVGGTISDLAGNTMKDKDNKFTPNGTFGGESTDNNIEPYISSIDVYNYGEDELIDEDDEIKISFSEEIEASSIHSDLEEGSSVENIAHDETGGVNVSAEGILTVTDITSFFVGDPGRDGEYEVTLSLNTKGDELSIKLSDGPSIELNNENLDDARQIGGVVEDKDEDEMDDDPNIADPEGTFTGESEGADIYISDIMAYDEGFAGYIDEKDKLVISFSEPILPSSVNSRLELGGSVDNIDPNETGGVEISDVGVFTVTDILSFDIGDIAEAGEFETALSLNEDGDELTVTLVEGPALKIDEENFRNTNQRGGYVENANEKVMNDKDSIDNPGGTFGGDSADSSPYITEISIDNGNSPDSIDTGDEIIVVFNKPIDPESVHEDLDFNDEEEDVDDDEVGGIDVDNDGKLRINGIAKFMAGEVDDDGDFNVDLHLNEQGNILTITVGEGIAIEIESLEMNQAEQIGGFIEDEDGNEMETDPRISDPEGTF